MKRAEVNGSVSHHSENELPHSVGSVEKKGKILDIAEKLFGEMGFEAVSTRMLAKEAGVNMAMISYYFGSKEKLFENLIERRANDGRERLMRVINVEASPWEKMNNVIDNYVERIFAKGNIHMIFSREMTLQQRTGVTGTICKYFMGNLEEVAKVIKEGQKQGIFRKIDTELTIMTITSLIAHVVNSQVMSRLLFKLAADEDITKNEKVKTRIKKHLKDMIRTHLECGSNRNT